MTLKAKLGKIMGLALVASALYVPAASAGPVVLTHNLPGTGTFGDGASVGSKIYNFADEWAFTGVKGEAIGFSTKSSVNSLSGSIAGVELSKVALWDETTSTFVGVAIPTHAAISGTTVAYSASLGPVTLTAGDKYDYIVFGTITGTGNYTGTYHVQAVPEAGEWAMMLLGLPLVSWMVRRRSATNLAVSA